MLEKQLERAHQFARLPLLDSLVKTCTEVDRANLASSVLVGVQHLLETTGSLFEALIASGLKPENVFLLGKLYSANVSVEARLRKLGLNIFQNKVPSHFGKFCDQFKLDTQALWASAEASGKLSRASQVIVLDDGGYAIAQTPRSLLARLPVCAVEQTMSGIRFAERANTNIPVIDVASCAAKTLLEPELISEAVFKRVSSIVSDSSRFGVLGMGNIGRAVAGALSRSDCSIFCFDKKGSNFCSEGPRFFNCATVAEVFRNSDTIFGCTGTDVLHGQTWWRELRGDKKLISCSSHDQEFRTILEHCQPSNVRDESALFSDAKICLTQGSLSVLRGGFPINFDGSTESVPANDIQLTRGLLMAGILQAAKISKVAALAGTHTLSPKAQKFVVDGWFRANPSRKLCYPEKALQVFTDQSSILSNSRSEKAPKLPYAVVV